MNKTHISLAIGGVLVLAGLLLPAEQIIAVLRGADTAVSAELIQGANLFRIGLVVLGGYALLLSLLPAPATQPQNPPAAAQAGPGELAILAGLLVLATGLRLYGLNTGIWFDEMLTHVKYMPLTVGQIISTFDDANNHILYSVFARLSLAGFGDTVWAFRLPAAAFGVAGIGALYYLARKLSNAPQSLFAVALLTFSYHHIWFSQNARGYTALLFFTLLSSALLINALQHNSRARWLIYSLCAGLGAFTHLTMGLVVLSHVAVYGMWMLRKPPRHQGPVWNGLLYGFIPVSLLTYQAYALVLPTMVGGGLLESGLQGDGIEWTNPLWALGEVINGMQVGFANGGVAIIAAGVFAIGLIDFARKRPEIAAFMLIPTGVGLLAMTSIGYTIFPRFFLFAMGFGVIIVMRGGALSGACLGRLVGFSEPRTAWMAALFCAGIVLASLPPLRFVYLPKQNYSAAIDLIEAEKQPGDRVIALGIADFPFNEYYGKGWDTVTTTAQLDALTAPAGKTWLVYTLPIQAQAAYPEILQRIERNYTIAGRFFGTLNGGEVIVAVQQAPKTSE